MAAATSRLGATVPAAARSARWSSAWCSMLAPGRAPRVLHRPPSFCTMAAAPPPPPPPPPSQPSSTELSRADVLGALRARPELVPAVLEAVLCTSDFKTAITVDVRRRLLARAVASDELRDEFRRADVDSDGRISWDEFLRWGEQLAAESAKDEAPPTGRQLFWLFARSALPFVGFGLVDNGLMVLTGEAIDSTFGVLLGISTMAAAALGNATSNVIGMGAHGTIERLVARAGIPNPRLTPQQLRRPSVHVLKVLGGALGVFAGCILGMTPLLFLNSKKRDDDEPREAKARR
ncbi:hypothetical protein KFE25_010854 [Diacronema lutheri]|uniref:EF-hand domain-containing protein n=2 Tax=Diacronema lutheri TaxID=2081491 RepID=A0A8J5XB17_DIALT|nr:hypothetical protein KFE25_010854 [Diacronema lutheri]